MTGPHSFRSTRWNFVHDFQALCAFPLVFCIVSSFCLLIFAPRSSAQDGAAPAAVRSAPAQSPEAAAAAAKARAAAATAKGGAVVVTPDGAAKPPDGEKKPDGQPGDDKSKDKKPEEVQPIKRPAKPEKDADPAELKAKPDSDGKVTFSFKGQPWQGVLEWLADVSHLSLDWQEVPGGYLDLTTRDKYTLDEARDLINSILLSKGYTLLRNGEVLLVVNLKTLDISLVPRVTPKELDARGNYELVRTFFNLDRLQAEPLVEELKPLLSPYGKINALKTTNRLDILDTAGNLRRIREIIGTEQGESGKEHQLRPYKLRYARADDVLATLHQLLGIPPEKGGGGGAMNPQQLQQQMQQQQQMMQQMQQQAQQNGGKMPKMQQEEKIYLAINYRENSILALATPDKLATIEEAIGMLDVPSAANNSLASLQRIQMYRLVAADPAPIVSVLKDLGNLDPSTRIEVDQANKAIIVSGPLVDHVTVKALIEKLDGSARQFYVLQLRKLDAEYVAGSIEFLMRGPSKTNNNQNRYFYDPYGNRQQETKSDAGFQIEPDTKNNRLLLRANDIEVEEIRNLMAKLGEDPFSAPHADTMRVIRSTPNRNTDDLLDKIKRVWPSVSTTPLELNVDDSDDPAADKAKGTDKEKGASPSPNDKQGVKQEENGKDKPQPAAKPGDNKPQLSRAGDSATAREASRQRTIPVSTEINTDTADAPKPNAGLLAESKTGVAEATSSDATDGNAGDVAPPAQRIGAGENNAFDQKPRTPRTPRGMEPHGTVDTSITPGPASISITKGPQGLIVTSRDPATLDQFMQLIDELSPQKAQYHMFPLKHTDPKDVTKLLESIFQNDAKKNDNNRSPFIYIFDDPPPKSEERGRLSKREPLRFIPDPVTSSILVENADEEQLAKIGSLIEYYDRAEPADSQWIRHTQIVQIKYAKAQSIADVLKDVYRDLLSSNDKALGNGQQQQQPQRGLFSLFDFDSGSSGSKTTEGMPKFKGLLSIGIESNSNSLVISAPQVLLTDVLVMVNRLDMQNKPVEPVTRVMNVGGVVDVATIREALRNVADPTNAKHSSSSPPPDQNNQNRNRNQNRGPFGGPNNGNNGNNGGNGNGNNGGNNRNGSQGFN